MASITVSGGGSVPSRSHVFTSDGSAEGHKKLFDEIEQYFSEWRAATADQDTAAAAAQASEAATTNTASSSSPASDGESPGET